MDADKVVYRYFVMPVLTLERSADGKTVRLCNIGGMDARDVHVLLAREKATQDKLIPIVKAGHHAAITVEDTQAIRIRHDDAYTILNGNLRLVRSTTK